MKKFAVLGMMLLLLGMPLVASATTIIPSDLCVDFRSQNWAPAHYQQQYTFGDVTAKAYNGYGKLWWDSIDGFGVKGGENDEIDHDERLKVFFSAPKVLCGAWVTDLYASPDAGIGEKGIVEVTLFDNSVQQFFFDGNNSNQMNGEQFVNFGGSLSVKYLKFFADNTYRDIQSCNNEFSVAGLACCDNPVPEPTTMLLLGLGLAGGGLIRRRRRS